MPQAAIPRIFWQDMGGQRSEQFVKARLGVRGPYDDLDGWGVVAQAHD